MLKLVRSVRVDCTTTDELTLTHIHTQRTHSQTQTQKFSQADAAKQHIHRNTRTNIRTPSLRLMLLNNVLDLHKLEALKMTTELAPVCDGHTPIDI